MSPHPLRAPSPVGSRSIGARLFSLAWPIIGLNVLNVLALAVDTAMCGRLPNADVALTALGFATQVVFLLMVAMMGLSVGSVALVARAYGAKQRERVNHVLTQSTQLTILLGLGIAVVGNLLAPLILRGLGATGPTVDAGLAYLRPLLTGTVFYYLVILYASVLRGVGNTRLPLAVALCSNVLNVFLNYGLILGNLGMPALGIQGAAIGTVCSHAMGVSLIVFLLRRGVVTDLYLRLRPTPIDTALARELVRIGTPAAMDMFILNAAFLSILGMLGRIEEVAVAAHGIGLRIQALAFVPGMSVAQATAALVGQALGRGDVDEARRVVRAAVVMSTGIMTVLATTIIMLVDPIVRIFDVDPGSTLGSLSVMWMRLLGYGMPIVGFNIAFVGMLQGAGSTRTSLGINLVGTLAFQIPLSFVLGFPLGLGAFGVWLAFPISFVIKAGLGLVAYRRGTWAKVGLHA